MRTINKRIISLILALIMLCGAMPISIFATMKTATAEENQWEGRSAVFVGDSITAGVGTEKIYYEYLDECLELGSVTPMGVSGSCISAFSDYGQSNQPLINRYENIPSADLIVVFMGTNDYGHETPLGSEQDTEDKTFYGALNVIIPALVEKHQSSKIVFVTSLHRYGRGTSGILGTNFTYDNIPNGVGATLGDYVNALKTVCAKNGVSVIDLYTECALDPTDATVRAEYMPDGLHPNAKGHEVIAEIIESHIRDYEPVEDEPLELPEMIQGNKFSATSNQPCRTSSRINYYLKAGTVITLKDPEVMQWACAKTSDEYSTNNLGYFPDSAWSDKESAVVAEDGWIGFTFKYRDETKSFDLTKPLSEFITIEAPDSHPNKAKYEGKVISILSASTSTFAGYIPEADGFNLAHRPRYPQDNLLTDVKETWWMQLINDLDAKLGINDSWAGSTVSNFIDGNSGDVGEDAAMASLTRIKNLGANGTPDVILFFGAGNDMGKGVELGSFDPATAPTEVDLTATKWDSFADAYVAAIMRLQHFYPDSKIVVMSTYAMPSYVTEAKLNKYGPVISAICEHYGVPYVDLRDSGVTFDMLPDNIHPNAEGMDHITAQMLEFLLENCELTEGENVVHSITNNLTNARSSLGYYKGISHGKEFTTAISGESVEVKVTMGGSDVTAACYSNGVISIPSVTGDVVITASGKFDCDGHLQNLPHNVCSDTNLWTVLERENIYYTASGWGNVSTGDSWSVTFPVKAGDKIFATAFGATPENGSSANGVRITWFNENGVLESLSRDKVYAEFVENGYVTAPAGATAINLPHSSNNSEFEVYILNRQHTYENGTCTGCGATSSPYLQQLPKDIIGCTNLYDILVPEKGYYTATKYDISNGDVISVVIPVESGDRIASSSFGSTSENMGSVNGIRVTYLLGDKIVTSLSAGEVYSEYTNNGYITVPDGVDAVCIPWWIPSVNNWLTLSQISKDFLIHSPKKVSTQEPTCTKVGYTAGEICEICDASLSGREEIPYSGHVYSGNTCTVCGFINLLTVLDGKYVSILGDSISTFNGYSNDATVNTTIGKNSHRYDVGIANTKPGSYCLLESVNQTWWMHFANRSGMKLLVNNSWAGSQVFGGQTGDGRVIPAAYLDRCINLHDNTLENNPENAPIDPDVIFVYLGINDYNFNRSNVGDGTVDYSSLVGNDGTYVTPTSFGEAYGIMLHKIRNAYPNAQIFAMTLLPENLYSVDKTAWEKHNTYIRAAAEYYDIPVVDLAENSDITWENYSGYMMDKIHPTSNGMKLISDCIETELLSYYSENLSHSHSYETVVTSPTCTEKGYTTYTCTCGDSYVDNYVDATGHNFQNGACSVCGTINPNPYAGKTIACIGDSITCGVGVTADKTDYVTLLAKSLDMEYIRLGASGTTLCTDGSRTCNIGKLTEQNLMNADVVTILMGINDFCAAGTGYYELGNINSTDTSTIYGAMRMWCERIEELRQLDSMDGTLFYFVTPVITSWNNSVSSARNWDQSKTNIHGYTLRDMCNAIIEVAALYDIPVVDLNLISGMYYVSAEDNNVSEIGGDGVHPGETGHQMMAFALKNALLENNLKDDHDHSYGSWVTTTYPGCYKGEQKRVCSVCSATENRQLDALGHNFQNGICTACGKNISLKGKSVSILGASISTYAGTSNGTAADTTNSTIKNNVKYYPNNTIPEVGLQDTWWMQLVNDFDLRLLVNNSWSGSAIFLERSGTVGAYVDRCLQLHDNTGDNAGETPDIIIIQMGFNDFSYGKSTLGTSNIDYDTLITENGYGTPSTTMEATAIMLDKITKRYPNAEIYMFNHFKRIGQSASDTSLMEELNTSISTVCGKFGVNVVDLYTVLNAPELIGDGRLHPNRLGMDVITEAVKSSILSNTQYESDICKITFDLKDVNADYGTDKIVLEGDPFIVNLSASDLLKVSVMMGGNDITSTVYNNGVISIDSVTGDVVITAQNVHVYKDYLFEFDGTDLVSVGETVNNLTKTEGTTANGVFTKTKYSLDKPVVLSHDKPWIVEWKCEGTFLNSGGGSGARIFTSTDVNAHYNARYIFKSNTNGIIAMGEKTTTGSHNYGIALGNHGIDWTALHTYKLENRIAEDGSNMIWLYVDGNEIGAMTDYYVGTNSQGTTSDWLSGKDFVFGYMGTDTHGFSNASINYIQVNECSHTYQNGICTACGEEEPTPGVNSVEELVEALREAMILREKNIVIRVNGLSLTGDDLHKAIIEAFEHTGDPRGGDYIKSHIVGGYDYNSEVLSDSDGVYSLVTVNCNFISTAEMEAEVDAAVDKLLKELDLWDASDYRKIKGVYDWICDNIEYDYDWDDEHPEENISYYQHTTHAAIIERKAVCQGISSLFYRLMLELDVDCRYITGIADQPGDTDYHAWNIVKLDGKYYNVDVTWDLGLTGYYRYFLCTETNFPWHIRDAEYKSDDFHTKYPMATLPYVENVTASGNLTPDISWVLDGDTGTLTVAGKGKIPSYGAPSYAPWYDYKDSIKTIIIGEGITEVGLRAFHWSINCTKVVLPESLIAVREYGFNNLRNLKSITLPSNLKIIEHCGFSECVALESIVLPDSVTTVDASAFANCYALKSATLSAGMKYIPSSMFFGDYRLTNVVLPEGITFIDDTAFADCGFKTFTIPSTLTKLGSSSFAGCKSLSKFIVEEGNTVYKSVDGVLFSADGTHLISYPAAKIGAYHIPEGTKYVDDSAFREQQYMTEVFFPSSLVEIGRYSFSYCKSLGKVTFPSTLLVLGDDAFRDCKNLYSVTFENQNVNLGDYLFSGCENLRNVTLPTGITEIPNGLFDDCVSLSSITIPSGVTSIGSTAFFNCDALKNVTIPSHVTYIGRQAFDYCQNLTTLTFEEGVKTIDRVAIRNAPRLNKVVIPTSVTSIGVENFESCPNVVLYVKCGTAGYNYALSKGIQYSSTHRYLSTVTYPPTCTEQGYTLYSCPCGKAASYRSDFTDRLPHDYVPTVTAPTCTEKGYTTHTCSMCGDSYVDSYVDMIEHSFGNWYEETAPTCTVDGLEKRECTRCDHYETNVLEKTGHNYTSVVTAPTCTEHGYTTHTCSKCGDTYVDSYVNALGHNLGNWYEVTAPTCTVDGLEKRECTRCDHYETRVLEKTGHSYMTVVTNPTCTEKGYTTHTCPCGDSYVDNYVDALGHTWGNGVVTKEPTEQETGIRTYTCKICGEKREEIIPILTHTHNYVEVVTPPTCTAQGYTTHTCDCGYSYVDKYVDAEGHNYTSVVTAPTCTERGYITHTCSKCGDTYTDSYVNKLGHSLGNWFEVTAPTCTVDGLEKRECTRCDHYETNVLEKTGHNYTSVVTAPTCTERGYTTHTCSKCGDAYTDSYVNKLGHNLGSWFEVIAPTCTTDGLEKRECTRCDHYETNVLEKTGHNYTSIVTVPICTERGYTTHTCSKCGDTYTDSYVNKLGHSLGSWYEVTAPTCTTDGLEKRECTRCDHYETRVLEKTGHTYTSVVTAPTCAERGYTTHTCSKCGDTYVDSYVNKLGHTWDEGTVTAEPTVNSKGEKLYVCVNCGEERREEIPELEEEPEKTGDVDGNDEVTSADAVHLLMYTFFPEDYPINQDADFDNSGTVDSNDAVYLLMYTFFPEDYPLIQPLCMAAEPPVRRREDEN